MAFGRPLSIIALLAKYVPEMALALAAFYFDSFRTIIL